LFGHTGRFPFGRRVILPPYNNYLSDYNAHFQPKSSIKFFFFDFENFFTVSRPFELIFNLQISSEPLLNRVYNENEALTIWQKKFHTRPLHA